ncbi:HNH endonuclease [Enterobacter sp. N18-03635]|uniref:HNH endonuclease n=1 Tax=Enterobacter sp. N18-03635 TaxID=2500132 RepID=UPI000FDBE0DC|nr:HNH endonuclease [Enterobacter sp. N18-03635]AZV06599.1 HNH endonuclease [Enterobacter sp. N18-03635]
MIKMARGNEPAVLSTNKDAWTHDLLTEVEKYQGYDKIPDDIKKKVVSHYRNEQIKDVLFATSHDKCAFCECIPSEGGNYVQVEHFHPKSTYPNECFAWENFLPCCGICNNNKGTLDTKNVEILNPYDDEIDGAFSVSYLKILPNLQSVKAVNTEKEVSLNSDRLISSRVGMLAKLQIQTEEIRQWTDVLLESDTDRKYEIRLGKLKDKVNTLEEFTKPESSHSFFCSEIIKDDIYYLKAKELIG